MDLGIHYANFNFPGGGAAIAPTLAATARAAEDGGLDLITVMDHWFQIESFGPAEEPMLEGYTALGFLAGLTERVRLSMLVTGVTYRQPALLAKTVTTLDVLSGGRAQLGIGAAWYEREHRGLGVPFPPLAERFERLEETLQICQQMWSADNGPFDGRYYHLAETLCSPSPIQQPRPPVLIGGGGERKTLRLVAKYADACNLFDAGTEVVSHKLEVLRGHCDTEGRDYASITKTLISGGGDPLDDVDGFLTRMEAYAALGVELVELSVLGPDPVAWVTQLGERVRPRLAELGRS